MGKMCAFFLMLLLVAATIACGGDETADPTKTLTPILESQAPETILDEPSKTVVTVTPAELPATPIPPTLNSLSVAMTQQAFTREVTTPIPTTTPGPLPLSAVIDATFNGNDCTVSSPAELPPGEYMATFTDHSDLRAELWLVYLEDGYTIQDHLDGQSEPGVWYPKPPWIFYDRRLSFERQESDGKMIETTIWKLDSIGEHNIVCWVPSPQRLWIVAPLMIVETASE